MWDKAFTLGWAAILGILIVYEFYALIFGHNKDAMLTQVTCHYVPWYVTMSFLTWLWIHFALRYSNATYLKDLDTNHPWKGLI